MQIDKYCLGEFKRLNNKNTDPKLLNGSVQVNVHEAV